MTLLRLTFFSSLGNKLKRPRDERGLVVQDVPEDIPDVLVLGLERAPIFPAMIKPIEVGPPFGCGYKDF